MDTATLARNRKRKRRIKVLQAKQNYRTKLLPGFELPLANLIALANQWPEENPDEN